MEGKSMIEFSPRTRSALLVLFLVAGVLAAVSNPAQAAQSGDADTREPDRALFEEPSFRDALGFGSPGPDAVWDPERGVRLTEAESSELERRTERVNDVLAAGVADQAVDGRFVPAFVDHNAGGIVVVIAGREDVEGLARATGLIEGVEIREARTSPEELIADLRTVGDSVLPGAEGVHVDWSSESVVVVMPRAATKDEVKAVEGQLSQLKVGNPVSVVVSADAELDQEAACITRNTCFGPLRAGIRIKRSGSSQSYDCTMGFHVEINGHEEAVTSGHCDTGSPNWWSHPAYGSVGPRTASLLNPYNNTDIMRFDIWDSNQDSNRIYGTGRVVTSSRFVIQGEAICVSKGHSNVMECGTATSNAAAWWSPSCPCQVYGADASFGAIVRDSGSPIYVEPPGNRAFAVGVLATTGGRFADIQYALNVWQATIRN